MSWATLDEVLKHHRMLTKGEAFFRQGAASFLIGIVCGLVLVISRFTSSVLLMASLSFFLFCLMNTFFPYKTSRRNSLEVTNGHIADIDSAGTSHCRSAITDNVAESTSRPPSCLLPKILSSQKVIFITEVIVSALVSYILVRVFLTLPSVVAFSEMVVIHTGASFLLINMLLAYIESREIDEFPEDWRDKSMLRFQKMFSYARNYFFVGEVKGKKIGLPRMLRFLHVMIGAPTGEGKSSSLIIPPLLFDADSDGSALVPDAKSPELFNWVAGRWIANGKRVFLFDPWHSETVGINPLPDADDNDLLTIVDVVMREREEILKEDAFFKSRTKYLLFAILKLVQSLDDKYCNLASVYRIVQSVDTLKSFINNSPEPIKKLFADFDDLYSETRVNALTSMREKLDVFMEPSVRMAFSKSEFKLNMLFREKEPCLLILGCPIDKKEPGTKIASLIVNLVVNLAFRERRLQKQAIQKGEVSYVPNDLYLYLDELRNLRITALADLVSVARETRTSIVDSVTDILFFKYYKEDFTSLMGNHRTRVFMKGLDYDSAKYVSDSLGKVNVATYKYFRGLMASQEQRNLLDPDKVMNLPEDKLIVFSPKTRPFIADKVSIYKTRWLMKMKREPPKSIRKYYEEWGLATEPLEDTIFPMIEGKTGSVVDFEKIKGNRKPEQLMTNVTVETFHRESFGGGVYRKEEKRVQDDSEQQKKRQEDDEDGGILGSV